MTAPKAMAGPVAGVGIRVGVEWDRRAPASWQHALDTAFPPSDHLSSLYLRWEPGDPWQPIERWVIWQLRPLRFTRPDVLASLRGPHPRSTGHYCAPGHCPSLASATGRCTVDSCPCKGLHTLAWRDGPAVPGGAPIDRGTWEVYRETGRYGVRWWTIQGEAGGHRHRLDPIEKQVAKLKSGISDTPAPGDLEYAEFDMRTFWKIAETDRVNAWKGACRFYERGASAMDAEQREVAERAGDLMWGWLDSQVRRTHESVGRRAWKAIADTVPRTPWAPETRADDDDIRQALTAQAVDNLTAA